uniref:RPA1 related single stranded DNA binding protein n=1 Tax=Cyclopterus lumpus TaxID=8103 RepID=A0A8C3AGN4_CYCLU
MEDSASCSSTVDGLPRESFLARTLARLSSTQCLNVSAEGAAPVAVVALQRYLSEKSEGLDSYSYDVTVTDGVWRAKCLVHPSLNGLVHSNSLRTGGDIDITQCSFVYDERVLGHGYICVEKLRCGAERSALLSRVKDVGALPMLVRRGMECSAALRSDAPLQVSRKHYLSLWNNDDPEGDIWTSGCSSSDTVLDGEILFSKITLLCSLESCFRKTWKPLPLLVKIIHKSRLRYYGKFELKIDYPYQAYFEVADQSGTMSLVLWNELCPEFYQSLSVGTVLYIQNYTLKQSYSNRSHPQMDHHRMKSLNVISPCVCFQEICLNPRNPISFLTLVSPKTVLPQWGLPEVCYQFTTRSELENVSHNSACDVIGLVTFVGRVERVKNKGNKEKYWTYRWIHAVDGTSDLPFVLEVFSTSQPEVFSRICPMTYLVCTQMRVRHVEGSLPYLTSSCETETFITGYHKGQPYVSDPGVKRFIQWTKTLKDNVVLQKTAVGGHYCYPRPPQAFSQSIADALSEENKQRILETLHYREHKKVAIQGQITAVRYMKSPKTSRGTEEKEVKDIFPKHFPPRAVTFFQFEKKSLLLGSTDFLQVQDVSTDACSGCGTSPTAAKSRCVTGAAQRQEVSEHLVRGGLHRASVSRRFTFDEKNVLLQQSNLQPTRWTAEGNADITPGVCPGYYQVTILGTVLSWELLRSQKVLKKRLLCCEIFRKQKNDSLTRTHSAFQNQCDSPDVCLAEEVLATAPELEDTHVVCVLDLCHLGGDEMEVLINKVYRVTEVSLN